MRSTSSPCSKRIGRRCQSESITEGRPKSINPLHFGVGHRLTTAKPTLSPRSPEAPELRRFQLPCSSIATCRAQRAALALVKYRTCFFSRLAWSMMR